jgi:hypothetical protein
MYDNQVFFEAQKNKEADFARQPLCEIIKS